MTNQAITVTKILAVHEKIERARTMETVVTSEKLKEGYASERMGMWEALHIMLGHEQMSQTINAVYALAKRNNKAAA